jgi:uncharacterized repeat protein (TIGR01451 family)
MLLRETLRRAVAYTAVGAILLASMMTALLQQSFGQSSTQIIDIPVSTIITNIGVGNTKLLETADVSQYKGLTCTVKGISENQSSVHPGNNLIVASGGSNVVLEDVERAPGVVTSASGELVLGNTVTVTLQMGQDDAFSAGILVKLTCEDPEIEVCRDGVLTPIKQSERRDTDTDPPCPEPPVVACESLVANMVSRDTYQFVVTASAANASIDRIDISFGDGNSDVDTSGALTASFQHTYAAPGDYSVNASVTYSADSQYFDGGKEHCQKVIVDIPEDPVYDLSLRKQVRNGDGTWVNANNPNTAPMFEVGDTVFWRVIVRNDLDTTATGVSVTDVFPAADLNFVDWSGDGSFDAGSLTWTIGTIEADDVFRIVFETTVKDTDQAKSIVNWAAITAMNEADVDSVVDDAIDGNQDDEDRAHIRVKPDEPPVPVAKCTGITILGQDGTEITMRANAHVENTTITGYIFSLDGSEVQNSASDTYVFNQSAPGSYMVTAVVVTEDLTSQVGACKTTVVIEDDHELACSAINVIERSRTEFSFQVLSFTTGNATVGTYELVESGTANVLGTNTEGAFTLTRDVVGDYTVRGYVNGTVNGEDVRVTSAGCTTTITVDPPEEEPEVHDCLGIRVDQLSRNRFELSASFTDGTSPSRFVYEVNDRVVQDGSKANLVFVAEDEGTYRIDLTAYVTVDGESVAVTCGTSITVVENEVRVLGTTTPTTPKHLPNTGAGAIATAALASVLGVAMAAHYTARHLYLRQFDLNQ